MIWLYLKSFLGGILFWAGGAVLGILIMIIYARVRFHASIDFPVEFFYSPKVIWYMVLCFAVGFVVSFYKSGGLD